MADTITIANRQFRGVTQDLSAAQDDYLIGHLRLAGAMGVLAPTATGAAPAPEERAEALLTQILVSGRAAYVLAGCLTEIREGAPVPWTAEEANRNALWFAGLTDPDAKRALRDALIGFVLGFFWFATASVAISRKSSSPS